MKRVFLLLNVLFIAGTVLAKDFPFFEGTLKEALDKAKKEDKIVMILASATWCEPCKRLTNEIMKDRDVFLYFSQEIVALKYYLDKEDPEGVADRFKITAYPTMIFLNTENQEIARLTGGSSTPADFLNRVESCTDPTNTPQAWQERIERNPEKTVDYMDYLVFVRYRIAEADSILEKSIRELPFSITFSENWIKYYRKIVVSPFSIVIKTMLDHSEEIEQVMGKDNYQKFMNHKAAYFLARNTNNKFYNREKLDKIIEFVDSVPIMHVEYLSFIKQAIEDVEQGNFEAVYRQAWKRVKKADFFSNMQMFNTVGMVGIQKNNMRYSDPRLLKLLDFMIESEEEPEYHQRLLRIKENMLKKDKEIQTGV